MERVTEKARAKLNLTMEVGERRPDGYHEIRSVMAFVELWDLVELEKAPAFSFRCSDPALDGPDNLAARAYGAMAERYPVGPVSIRLTKRIPCQSGMGGGSADAAAVLHGLNRMFKANLPLETLVELGAKVGADVPFCVAGGTCRCKGIGEQVERAPAMPDCWLVLCKPPAGMSTPRAYALIDQFPISRAQATDRMISLLSGGDLRRIGEGLANRFDETMKLSQVREIKRVMQGSGALVGSMTGSGSAVFGIFDSEEAARACSQELEGKGRLYLARPLDHGWEFIPDK